MYAFIYQAAFICEDCEPKVQDAIIMRGLDKPNGWAKFLDPFAREDSDIFPQGPFSDGGGEADCPQHCDSCGAFLHNPLTSDGEEYVRNCILDWQLDGEPADSVVLEWIDEYVC